MSFEINQFLSRISTHGAAKQNLFRVRVNPPLKIGNTERMPGVNSEHLSFRIDNVDLPGRNIDTIDYSTDIGRMRQIPYNAGYLPVTTSIICSDDMREKLFFEDWQSLMVGEHAAVGTPGSNAVDTHPSAGSNWSVGYYDDYIGNLVIETFDETGKAAYMCSLEECFPQQITNMSAGWASNDVHKVQVVWYYRYFRDQRATLQFAGDVNTGGFFNKSGLGALVGVGAGALAGKLGPKAGALVGGAVGVAGRLASG